MNPLLVQYFAGVKENLRANVVLLGFAFLLGAGLATAVCALVWR